MYRGFNLELDGATFPAGSYERGLRLHARHKAMVEKVLDGFITSSGALDASKMQENWFPQINANIFISHSHRDQETAISLAGWLKDVFSIESFVDSCAWGFCDDLLQLIDDKFCYKADRKIYSYEKRNRSTSHVHMMLSTALLMMLDKTECIFFLNTPSSLLPKDTIGYSGEATTSPWIYSEIAITRLIQKNKDAHRGKIKEAMTKSEREMIFMYSTNLNHLTDLVIQDLRNWYENRTSYASAWDAMDGLYELKPQIGRSALFISDR